MYLWDARLLQSKLEPRLDWLFEHVVKSDDDDQSARRYSAHSNKRSLALNISALKCEPKSLFLDFGDTLYLMYLMYSNKSTPCGRRG